MKIRVAVYERDTNYSGRLAKAFNSSFFDKIEILIFSDIEIARRELQRVKVDIFLFSDDFKNVDEVIRGECIPLVLVESKDVAEVGNIPAICKYQKVSSIYKRILSVYSQNTTYSFVSNQNGDKGRIIVFCGVAGGVGTSTVAVGYAMQKAKMNKKVLYLDLNFVSNVSVLLSGEGDATLTNVFYDVKSKKMNLGLKIESAIRMDASGVYFIQEPVMILDMLEISQDEILVVLDEINKLNDFDFIVLDIPFKLEGYPLAVIKKADHVVWISDGSHHANGKIVRAFNSVCVFEEQTNTVILTKLSLIYNRFSSKSGQVIEGMDLKTLGGINKYEGAEEKQVLKYICDMDVLKNIDGELLHG